MSPHPDRDTFPIVELSLYSQEWQFFIVPGEVCSDSDLECMKRNKEVANPNESSNWDDFSYTYFTQLDTECFINGQRGPALITHPQILMITYPGIPDGVKDTTVGFEFGKSKLYTIQCTQLRLGVLPIFALDATQTASPPLMAVTVLDSGYYDYVDLYPSSTPNPNGNQSNGSALRKVILGFSVSIVILLGLTIILVIVIFVLWKFQWLESIWPRLSDYIDDRYYQRFYPEIVANHTAPVIPTPNQSQNQLQSQQEMQPSRRRNQSKPRFAHNQSDMSSDQSSIVNDAPYVSTDRRTSIN
jgi:hypothetical protein